jgi:hypothetical protein
VEAPRVEAEAGAEALKILALPHHCIQDTSGIYLGYILDKSISQINLEYIQNVSQNITQVYLGYILKFI